MAQKSPVHIEVRENGWAVVREGHKRAASVHRTQAEAAKEGRDIARREATEFFLHAQDGRVREHRDYGEEPRPADKGVVDQAAGTVTGAVSTAVQTLGAAGSATTRAAESEANPGLDQRGDATNEETSGTEEVHGLTDARHDDSFGTPEQQYAGYEVYDQNGERIGKLDDLFVDENDQPEYVGVRTDPLGTSSALIPADTVTVDDSLRHMVISRPKSVVDAGPSLGQDEELTPDVEERVRGHYGLASPRISGDRGSYGAYYPGKERASTERTDSDTAIPSETGEVHAGTRDHEDLPDLGVPEDEDELRMRRSEEELRVGTREREAGTVRVRKRVRTERERVLVPKKRVEVTVERLPVEEEAASTVGEDAGPEIKEDEIVVPVVEEEIVIEKRPVVKEEIRIRKNVVEETEVVEEDVRREEVEVTDETPERDNPAGGADPARGR